jgi:hypothetical protein
MYSDKFFSHPDSFVLGTDSSLASQAFLSRILCTMSQKLCVIVKEKYGIDSECGQRSLHESIVYRLNL